MWRMVPSTNSAVVLFGVKGLSRASAVSRAISALRAAFAVSSAARATRGRWGHADKPCPHQLPTMNTNPALAVLPAVAGDRWGQNSHQRSSDEGTQPTHRRMRLRNRHRETVRIPTLTSRPDRSAFLIPRLPAQTGMPWLTTTTGQENGSSLFPMETAESG